MKKLFKKYKVAIENTISGKSKEDNLLERRRLMKVNRFLSNFKVITLIYWITIVIVLIIITLVLNSLSGAGLSSLLTEGDITYEEKISFLDTIIECRIIYYFLLPLSVILYIKVLYDVRVSFGSLDVGQGGSTSRWTTREELEAQYKKIPDKDARFPGKGGPPIARDGDFLYIDDGQVNNLVIGTSRSGKGEEHVLPSIDIYSRAEDQASMIITDPKMELAPTTMATLQERGYDCHILNFVDPAYSMTYNPLPVIVREIKEGSYPTAQQLCRSLGYNIITPNPDEKDPYWSDQARNVLIAAIWADIEDNLAADKELNARRLYHHKKEEAGKKAAAIGKLNDKDAALYWIKEEAECLMDVEPTLTYYGLFSLLKNADLPLLAKEVISKMDINNFPRYVMQSKPLIAYSPADFVPTTENEDKINLYSIVRMVNTLFSMPTDKNNTALDLYFMRREENDFARQTYSSIGSVNNTGNTKGTIMSVFQQKTSIFLYDDIGRMMSKNDLDFLDVGFGVKPVAVFIALPDYDKSNHFIPLVFISQLFFTLSKVATAVPSGRTLRDVVFLLDEFGSLPPIDNIGTYVTDGLGRGFRFHFIIQSLSQIYDKYGEQTARTMLDNCGNQKYILTTSTDTSKYISEALGDASYTTVNRTGKKLSIHKEQTEMHDKGPLASARQLTELLPGETIVLRYLKRTDNDSKPVRTTPIANIGEYRMKFRYEYLLDTLPSGRVLYKSPNMDRLIEHNPNFADMPITLAGVHVPDTSSIDLEQISRSGKAYLDNLYYTGALLRNHCEHNPRAVYELLELIGTPDYEREQLLSPDSNVSIADMFAYAHTLLSTGQPDAMDIGYRMLDILDPIEYANDTEDEDLKAAAAFEEAGLDYDFGA